MRFSTLAGLVAATIVVLVPATAGAWQTSRVNVSSAGVQADLGSTYSSVSANGRRIAFDSSARNLVPGDTNGFIDVFVRDLDTGVTMRVSVASDGTEGDSHSWNPALSRDGRFVAFESGSANLVARDTNHGVDIFMHDTATGTTTRVSTSSSGSQASGNSVDAAISADGSFVAFTSSAAELVPGDGNHREDVYLKNTQTGTIIRMSVDSAGGDSDGSSWGAAISDDGSIVAFASGARDLVPGDTNGAADVFVRDSVRGTTHGTTLVSADSLGNQGNGWSGRWNGAYGAVALSGDGLTVAFESLADNLVPSDRNRQGDIFVHDRVTATTERVSVDSSGNEGNLASSHPSFAMNDAIVAFASTATGLVPGDRNAVEDVFIHDRTSGVTSLVSVGCHRADEHCRYPAISGDGLAVTFSSDSDGLVHDDTNHTSDIFLNDRHGIDDAWWAYYGTGFPGTRSTPALYPAADPVIYDPLSITLSNSLGRSTVGLVLIGLAQADVPTSAGGHLLVAPLVLQLIVINSFGAFLAGEVPCELLSTSVYLQVLEVDPGAAFGLSFTSGLEVHFGF